MFTVGRELFFVSRYKKRRYKPAEHREKTIRGLNASTCGIPKYQSDSLMNWKTLSANMMISKKKKKLSS